MVKRVFGLVDGTEVELYCAEGGRWSITVPFATDGEYVVEILAEDEAGNRSYMAKVLFVVNTALLCAHMERVPFYGQLLEPVICGNLINAKYYSELIDPSCQERR